MFPMGMNELDRVRQHQRSETKKRPSAMEDDASEESSGSPWRAMKRLRVEEVTMHEPHQSGWPAGTPTPHHQQHHEILSWDHESNGHHSHPISLNSSSSSSMGHHVEYGKRRDAHLTGSSPIPTPNEAPCPRSSPFCC